MRNPNPSQGSIMPSVNQETERDSSPISGPSDQSQWTIAQKRTKAAQTLRTRKNEILSAWEERVRDSIPHSREETSSVLKDSLPRYLEVYAEVLDGTLSAEKCISDKMIGFEHGAQRAEQTKLSIDQVISEYHVLQRILVGVLRAVIGVSIEIEDELNDFLHAGMQQVAKGYAQEQDRKERLIAAELAATADKVKRSEAQLRSVLDNSTSVIYLKDLEGRALLVNKRFEALFGVRMESVVGKTDFDLFDAERAHAFRVNDEKVIASMTAMEFEEIAPHQDGLHTYLSIKAPVFDENGNVACLCGISTDITDRKRIEVIKEQFVNTLSHDLRNPLSAAKMAAWLIQQDKSLEAHVDYAERIAANVSRADQMIRDLLDANRIREGQLPELEFGPVNLCDITEYVRREQISMHGDRFDFKCMGNVEGHWNEHGIIRVLENLLSNGIKYGAANATVALLVADEGDTVRISVHNVGNPIPEAEQRNLFDPYFRSKDAKSSGKQGWGLGLTVVQGLVEAHCGQISVRSSADQGTTFIVTLPRFSDEVRKAG